MNIWSVQLLTYEKNGIGDLTPVDTFCEDILRYRQYKRYPNSPSIARSVATLANQVNGDPADRILVATAQVHNATLLTANRNLQSLKFTTTVDL